jgi:hypothetical protein
VLFTIQAAFRKSVTHEAWSKAKIGDKLILFGKEPPQFLYGDGQFKPVMTMEVTAVLTVSPCPTKVSFSPLPPLVRAGRAANFRSFRHFSKF